jgi:hypothetical protein
VAVQRWTRTNGLCFNATKTKFLLCGTQQKTSIARRMMNEISICLTLDTAVLDVVRNLGVRFDETQSRKDQVNRVVKQVFLKLRQLIHYFLYLLSPSIKIKLVKSLVLPIYDYAASVFVKLELTWK